MAFQIVKIKTLILPPERGEMEGALPVITRSSTTWWSRWIAKT